jgi:hypothetical protein
MMNRHPLKNSMTALLLFVLPFSAYAARVTPPRVPANLIVPAGNEAFLVGHATGTQNYVCLPQGSAFGFVLFTPVATLLNDSDNQVTTHFFSLNPDEPGTVRATWLHSVDTSAVWCQAKTGNNSTDPSFVAPNSIAWLLLTVVGSHQGPTGGHALSDATYIQRVNTSGGLAPATGCTSAADVGRAAYVPYTADYYFFKPLGHEDIPGAQTPIP